MSKDRVIEEQKLNEKELQSRPLHTPERGAESEQASEEDYEFPDEHMSSNTKVASTDDILSSPKKRPAASEPLSPSVMSEVLSSKRAKLDDSDDQSFQK